MDHGVHEVGAERATRFLPGLLDTALSHAAPLEDRRFSFGVRKLACATKAAASRRTPKSGRSGTACQRGPDEAGPSKVLATLTLPSYLMADVGILWRGTLRRARTGGRGWVSAALDSRLHGNDGFSRRTTEPD